MRTAHPITADVVTASRDSREGGFTLVEMMVALLVLAIVLAAVAPAFWGSLKATAATDQRSVADGLAVAASEQIRALPYYQVGYSSTPSYCTGSSPVVFPYSTPMSGFAATQTVRGTTYQVQSCVYWVTASDGSSEAYKQSIVTILWGPSDQYKYTQTSALYPGGESPYATSGAASNFEPTTTVATGTAPPAPPIANSAIPYQTSSTDTTTPQTTIDVNWQPVNYTSTVSYNIEYWTGSTTRPAGGAGVSNATPQPVSGSPNSSTSPASLDYQVGSLAPGTTYYFDVVAVSGSQVSQPSNVVQAQTYTASGSPCAVCSINVTPSRPVTKNGSPVGWSSLSVTVQTSLTCSTLMVEYGVNGSNGQPQGPLTGVTLADSGGSCVGSATQSSWALSTYGFVVYQNGSQYVPLTQANVTPCNENGNSGKC